MTEATETTERHHTAYIAGAKFRPQAEQIHLAGIKDGAELSLNPEPTNKYDPHAVQVTHEGHHVGYVPRDLSAEVSKLFAAGRITRVVKGEDVSFKLAFSMMPDAPPLVINYTGKLKGDELQLTSVMDMGQGPVETKLVAKRAK